MARIQRALLSVTDKKGVADLARELQGMDVEVISTGGTAKTIREAGVSVRDVSDLTGFPEMMDGRHGIAPIDMVVVNLYAFEKTVAKEGVLLEDAIENIDIGGPTLLRSSAKNFRYVTVIVDPSDYGRVLREMRDSGGSTSLATRFELARKVFETTNRYDQAIAAYLKGIDPGTNRYFSTR
jgi:phosphoribosylaminoimidazolecarboxamide formyltransferase/IMP cyclohydrolase